MHKMTLTCSIAQGFSLLELMITLAIIGILSAISFPLYTQHITHEKRIEAEITLEKLAAALEQYYIMHNTYRDAALEKLNIPDSIAENNYRILIASATETEFRIAAIPQGKQVEKDPACGTLMLNTFGEKSVSGAGKNNDCW